MLNKSLRGHLLKQKSWDKALRKMEDTNPSQTWRRTRDRLKTGINDLVLMAELLPEEKQAELFDLKTIERLSRAILGYCSTKEAKLMMAKSENPKVFEASGGLRNPWERDLRRTMIAGEVAALALNFCSYQLQLIEEAQPLIDPIAQIFDQAAAMAMMMHLKVERYSPLPALINSKKMNDDSPESM